MGSHSAPLPDVPRSVRQILRASIFRELRLSWKVAAAAAVVGSVLFAIDTFLPHQLVNMVWSALLAGVVSTAVLVTPLLLFRANQVEDSPLMLSLGTTRAMREARVAEIDQELARAELVPVGRHYAFVAPSLVLWVGEPPILLEREKVLGVQVVTHTVGRWVVVVQHRLQGAISLELPPDDARMFASWFRGWRQA